MRFVPVDDDIMYTLEEMCIRDRYQCSGMPDFPITAPTILPAVAAVQSLSSPIATVSEITLVKSLPPR